MSKPNSNSLLARFSPRARWMRLGLALSLAGAPVLMTSGCSERSGRKKASAKKKGKRASVDDKAKDAKAKDAKAKAADTKKPKVEPAKTKAAPGLE